MTSTDLLAILPAGLTAIWAMLLLLLNTFLPESRRWLTPILAAAGFLAALAITLTQAGQTLAAFNGMLVVDGFSTFLNVLFLLTGLAGLALAYDYIRRLEISRGEYYVMLMFTVSGMMLMAQSADLIVVFLALELLSIPLYILAGFARPRGESEEASLKYFLLGSFAGGFVLYGVALVFGATASTGLQGIAAAVSAGSANLPLFLVGAALILVGFGFKVAAVPFHMWTPDVYQGAPSSVTGFMSVGAKAAGFAALLRVFILIFPGLSTSLTPVFWVVSALTMIIGNLAAISQTSIKRLLAYSSIAHAGYILMALVPYGDPHLVSASLSSALFYLAAYGITSLGAWAVVVALEKKDGSGLLVEDYAGLSRRSPLLAAAMLIFMLSFAGVPPTMGFWGKFYLFRSVISGGYTSLVIIALLTSLISAYYYLRVVVMMYMREGNPATATDFWVRAAAAAAAVLILVFSILPGPLFAWAANAGLIVY